LPPNTRCTRRPPCDHERPRVSADVIQTKNLGSLLFRGRGTSGSSWHRAPSWGSRASRPRGAFHHPAVGRSTWRRPDRIRLLRNIGVVCITAVPSGEASGSFEQRRPAAARRRRIGPALVRALGSSQHVVCLGRAVEVVVLGMPQSVTIAPLCGWFECRGRGEHLSGDSPIRGAV
jgi:hypothetical protein